MFSKKLTPVLPKNIFQSIVMTLVLIIISILIIAFFDLYIIHYFKDFSLFTLSKDICTYSAAFLILHFLSRKEIKSYNFKIPKHPTFLLIIVVSLSFAISIGIPSYFLLLNNINYHNPLTLPSTKVSIYGIVGIVIIAPLFEELIMRGIILDGLLKNNGWVKSIIITTIIFILIHFDLFKTPGLVFSGLFLGWIYYKTKNLILTVAFHLIYNLINTIHPILVTNDFRNYKYFGEYTNLIIIISLMIFLVSIYLLKRVLERVRSC